jgi:predicted nucleic-acid-binding protein
MVAIDSNVIIRWLVRDDEVLAAKADSILKSAKPRSLLIDRLIIAEISYVLKSVYKFEKPEIVLNLNLLLTEHYFTVMDRDLVTLMVETFAKESPLSMEDSWLLALKITGKVSDVATLDKQLKSRL